MADDPVTLTAPPEVETVWAPTAKWLVGAVGSLLVVIASLIVWIFTDGRQSERSFEVEVKSRIGALEATAHRLELQQAKIEARCAK